MSNSGHKRVVFACLANCLTRKESMDRVKDERADPRSRLPSTLGASSEETSTSGMGQVMVSHTKHWLENLSTFVNLDPLSSVDTNMPVSSCSCDSAMEHDSTSRGNCMKPNDEICSCGERRSAEDGWPCSACQESPKDEVRFKTMEKKSEDQCSCSASSVDTGSCRLYSGQQNPRNQLSLQVVDSKNVEQMSIGCSSSASISLPMELVMLNMNVHHHLGITVVGHSIKKLGDCGIFVGCVKRGGAAAINGQIEPGDLILEVNGIDLESLSNEQAVRVLREELAKGGIVQLLIVKCWNLKSDDNIENVVEEPVYERIETLNPSGSFKSHVPSTAARRTSHQPGKSKRARQFHEGSGRSEKEVKLAHSPSCISPPLRVVPSVGPCLKNASRVSSSTPIQCNGVDSGLQKLQLSDILSFSTSTIPGSRTSLRNMNQSGTFLGADFLEWIQSCGEKHLSWESAISYANWLLQTGCIRNTNSCTNRHFNENLHYRLISQMQPVHK